MPNASDIRPHMEVLGSDGLHLGTVDHVEGDRIKLTRQDSNDGRHHYIALADVTRIDTHVHVATTGAALGIPAVAGVTGATVDHGTAPFPPVKNRQVSGSRPRGNFYLPWIAALVGLLLLVLLIRSCMGAGDTTAAVTTPAAVPGEVAGPALPVETVTLPGGQTVDVTPNTLNYELQRYLASDQPTPRTFTFDELNFDTGSAAIRAEDQANVDALARILAAYPQARGQVVGYTDARGGAGMNAQLGQQRATAVVDALVAKGVDAGRLQAASGGEANPADTNATADGRFENRRSELVITAK